MRSCVGIVIALSAFLLGASEAWAGTPKVVRLQPFGGQRGTTVDVYLYGRNLDRPREVLFYEPGITAETVEIADKVPDASGRMSPVEPGQYAHIRLKIAADCPLGPHGLRLVTVDGVAEFRRFFVGPFPTVEETETTTKRNDTRETAQEVPLNCTVLGRMNGPSDVDMYRINVKRGQRISGEIECAMVGVERGVPDLHLAIFDADGKKLAAADDSALHLQDPVLSVLAERDGPHFVEVRHCMYNAAGEVYRLHIGTFTRPTAIYPAGGPAGAELKVQILGDPRGVWQQTVRLPATPGDFSFVAVDPKDGVSAPSPNRLRVSAFPNVMETEPNDSPEALASVAAVSLPAAFNGIINKPGDVDCFRFRAKKGEQFTFHALANAFGSPMNPVIWIKQIGGRTNAPVMRGVDSRPNQLGLAPVGGLNRDTHDPIIEFSAPVDGDYVLGVEDERGAGGADFVYRVEAQPQQNAVYTYIAPEPENQFQPQLRQAIAVAAGNRFTAQIGIFSTNRPVSGELEIVGVNLPKGVTVHAAKLTPGMTRVPVVFEAAADAKPQAALIDLAVRPVGGKEPLVSGYRQTIAMNQYGNNDYYLHVPIGKLALAVTESAPFRVEVEEPKSALVQNGEMTLKFKVHRAKDFTGEVTVQMDFKPSGINTATPVTLAADKSEGEYILGASRNATAGAQQVTLTAMSGSGRRGYYDNTNRSYVASQLFRLTVAEPHIEAKIARTSIERGKTTTLVCKLNHLQPIAGKAQATLARLPRGIEMVEPMKEITSADKEVSFTLRATPEALVGNYQGIVLDLTVQDNGQPVRQLSGSGLLRVDAERGAKPKNK
jgi:hypothetical protein